MNYFIINPPPTLREYVRFFWVFESGPGSDEPYVYRSMADGCAELIFHYKGVFEEVAAECSLNPSFSLVQAPSRKFRRFSTNENFGIFGVYLYPFALPAIFSLPSASLIDHMPQLETLAGQQGREVEEMMMLAGGHRERVKIITAFLEKSIARNKPVDNRMQTAIRQVIHSKHVFSVEELASTYCLSTRQFERTFKEYAGFSPKIYSRIIRFQSALKAYGLKGKSLTEIAYDCGYYDQSHFINDFKEFSGYNPKAYFSGKPEGVEYREI